MIDPDYMAMDSHIEDFISLFIGMAKDGSSLSEDEIRAMEGLMRVSKTVLLASKMSQQLAKEYGLPEVVMPWQRNPDR